MIFIFPKSFDRTQMNKSSVNWLLICVQEKIKQICWIIHETVASI